MFTLNEFKLETGIQVYKRQTNCVTDMVERKDQLFYDLARFYSRNTDKYRKLQNKFKELFKKEQSETLHALEGYISYINEDFPKAKCCFLKAISVNPDNLDNWMDLAFSLRHSGEYKVSNGILFNYHYVIYYYKYFKINGCSYSQIRKIILQIMSKRIENDSIL